MSHVYNSHSSDDIQANNAFDVASLVLYGTNALPVRLKILLDRIFCTLSYEELLHLLNEFGWTHEDYARGYIHEVSLNWLNLFLLLHCLIKFKVWLQFMNER